MHSRLTPGELSRIGDAMEEGVSRKRRASGAAARATTPLAPRGTPR